MKSRGRNFTAECRAALRRLLGGLLRAAAWCAARLSPRRPPAPPSPQRILILNGAHIGDLIIATSLLPVLRSAWPEARIGFAAGSWASMVLRNHPDVAWVHEIDHWRLNRGSAGFFPKLRRYVTSRRRALREIRSVGYDLSLSIYPVFPDFLDLAWQARIPVRVAFRSSRLAPLATALSTFPTSNPFLHQGARQAEILRPLGLDPSHLARRRSVLPPSSPQAIAELCALLQVPDIAGVRYRIIHMGSGAEWREMSPEFWHEVARAASRHCIVLFTGRGSRESANAARAIDGLPNCINACDRLSWEGFIAAVRHAELLYGVESMAGHVAAAVGTPCRVVYAGAAGVPCWRPESPAALVFTQHVPCAPCIYGCTDMPCLDVAPAQVIELS